LSRHVLKLSPARTGVPYSTTSAASSLPRSARSPEQVALGKHVFISHCPRSHDWQHTLTLSDVRKGDPALAYPRFIGGERDCPPEDCGGISGFYGMLEIRSDPKHEQYAEINDWLDGYDPEELDTLPIEVALGRIAARRNAAAKRIVKPEATLPRPLRPSTDGYKPVIGLRGRSLSRGLPSRSAAKG